jgi:hypothetical protein
MAVALEHIGFTLTIEGDDQTAYARLAEGVALAREVEDRWPLALCLVRLASPLMQIDMTESLRVRKEGVAVARSIGDKPTLCQGLNGLAASYLTIGDLSAAASTAEEAWAEARAIESATQTLLAFLVLVLIACAQGDLAKGKAYCAEVISLAREKGVPILHPLFVYPVGLVSCLGGQPQRGVRLLAWSINLAHLSNIKLLDTEGLRAVQGRLLETARAQLGADAFQSAWDAGQQLTSEQALALATEDTGDASQPG